MISTSLKNETNGEFRYMKMKLLILTADYSGVRSQKQSQPTSNCLTIRQLLDAVLELIFHFGHEMDKRLQNVNIKEKFKSIIFTNINSKKRLNYYRTTLAELTEVLNRQMVQELQ